VNDVVPGNLVCIVDQGLPGVSSAQEVVLLVGLMRSPQAVGRSCGKLPNGEQHSAASSPALQVGPAPPDQFLSSRPIWDHPPPLTRSRVCPPIGSEGRYTVYIRLRERGWGVPIRTWGQTLWYFRYICTVLCGRSQIQRQPKKWGLPFLVFFLGLIHCKKRLAIFPSPAGMSLTKLSLAGSNLIIPGQENR
jgi:hypothetical protein